MSTNRHVYAKGTWTETRSPWGVFTRARALCPDGRLRVVRLALTADTFSSVPARVSYRGLTVSGFITWRSDSGLSTDPVQYVAFVPTGRHRDVFKRAALCARLGVRDSIPDEVLHDLCQDRGVATDF